MSSVRARGTRRRDLLLGVPAAALAAAGVAACSDDPPAPEPPPVDPDVALREAAAQRERALLQAYDAVLSTLPELAARLVPLQEHHHAHLAALLGPPSGASTASAPPVPTDAPAAPPAVPPPPTAAAALARLAAAERATGDAHAQAALSASRPLAGVLASLSAGERSHLVVLR